MSRIILVLALISLASSCCNVKETAFVELPLPEPISPNMTLTQEDLVNVSDQTLNKIILLDKRRKTLREIIKATHSE